MEREGRLRVFFRTMIKDRPELQSPDWQLCWDRGSLSDVSTGEETLYLHMMDLKRSKGFRWPAWSEVPDQFYVTRVGFFRHKQDVSLNPRTGLTAFWRRLRDRVSSLGSGPVVGS